NFYAVSGGEPAETAEEAEESDAEAAAPSASSPPPPPLETQRLYLAIFIDNRSLAPAGRNLILESVKEFIAKLQPEDRVLLASYDGSVQIRQGLTGDPAAIGAALAEAARVAPGAMSRDADRQSLVRRLDAEDPVNFGEPGGESNNQRREAAIFVADQLFQEIRTYAQQRSDETRGALQALREFVDSLAGLPGRKALLYVSGGYSLRPAEALLRAWENKFSALKERVQFSPFDAFQSDAQRWIQELVDYANSSRVTFYTLGATTELAGVSAESRGSAAFSSDLEVTERTNLQSPLLMIADGTGGLASVDGPGRPLLDRMREDFDSYYSLGYVPRKGRDGRKRSVEVKMRDRALVVRHRTAHRERTNPERMASRTMAALLLGEESNPLELALEFGKEKKNDKGQYEVEVLIKFPLVRLVLLPKEQFHEGRLTVTVGARDSHGRTSPIQRIEIPIRVPNDQLLTALGQMGAYRMTLLLRPEGHTVAVAVHDELGHADSTVKADHTPGQQPAAEPTEASPGS
ncbi:MAG TPA: VWA domain-containing protein, partial [Thermoanaerobaculia bacterium]|nr:VWA domain-containing protein [Thermoanaerobaculia bacterium]